MALALISFERLKAMVDPSSVRLVTREDMLPKFIAVWSVSAVVASPLLYAYQTQTDDTGTVSCTNIMFGDLARQIYHTIHAFCFFFVHNSCSKDNFSFLTLKICIKYIKHHSFRTV